MENTSSSAEVQRTWMPPTAGILTIIAGAITLIIGLVVATMSEWIAALLGYWGGALWAPVLGAIGLPVIIVGVIVIVVGVIAIIGGSFAIKRKAWGMALVGAIFALPFTILGILAIIFVSISKKEFA